MTTRGLIIAVEDYPQSNSTARQLPGTVAGAEAFATWLETSLHLPAEQILFCCSGKCRRHARGATSGDVKEAVKQLLREGVNATDCLYLFLSGHGITRPGAGPEPHQDFLLTSDFVDSRESGNACIRIDELTTVLARGLGAGSHLAFVDACRTMDGTFLPASMGLNPEPATSGTAARFRLLSASPGEAAANDGVFVGTLLKSLQGGLSCELDEEDENLRWVTFQSVVHDVENELSRLQRAPETKTEGKSNYRIRAVQRAGPTRTILDAAGHKAPPVELLTQFDEIIFLGETNSQLAGSPRDANWKVIEGRQNFLQQAFALRGRRRWKRLEVFSIDDLSTAGRPERTREELEQERHETEEFLRHHAAEITDELRLYRYQYAGVYGSLWTDRDGKRRAHVSPLLPGVNVRTAPAYDFIDYPEHRLSMVNQYFDMVRHILAKPTTRCLFHHAAET